MFLFFSKISLKRKAKLYPKNFIFSKLYQNKRKICFIPSLACSHPSLINQTCEPAPLSSESLVYDFLKNLYFNKVEVIDQNSAGQYYWPAQCRSIIPYWPEPSQMSVGAVWPCLWVLAFCAGCWCAGMLYNREKNESLWRTE